MKLIGAMPLLLAVVFLPVAAIGPAVATDLSRIVVLSVSAPADQMRAFEDGLRTRGLIHGSTVDLVHVTADGRTEALPLRAKEAVSMTPKVIVAVGTKAALAAQGATNQIPIIAVTGDMQSAGLVENFNRPEGNVTGFSFFTLELSAKRVELLQKVNPSLRHLKILMPVQRHSTQVLALSMLEATLADKGIVAEVLEVQHIDELEWRIASVASSPEESLLIRPSVRFDARASEIGGMIAKHRIIAMVPWKEYVEGGALISYAPDIVAIWRETSTYVDRVLRGAKPGELPVVSPTVFELTINLRAARELALEIPTTILLRADRVIE